MRKKSSSKIIPLESARGIAALIVFFFHFFIGYLPGIQGQEVAVAIEGGNLKDTIFFFLINGHAAVMFFFVLSGFVLSYHYFSKEYNEGLIRSFVKRWPRLFPLALISTIYSYFMFKYDFYHHLEVSAITGSHWMQTFAKAGQEASRASFGDAFMQGFFYTFFRGDNNFNSSLWTMYYEFIGSIMVFGFIPLINNKKFVPACILYATLIALCYQNNLIWLAFITGSFLCYFHCQVKKPSLSFFKIPIAALAAIFSMVFFGYIEPGTGFYAFMKDIDFIKPQSLRIILHILSSVITIILILNVKFIYKLLESKIGAFLGKCSFALYLIHVPLLFSFSNYLYLILIKDYSQTTTSIIVLLCTLPVLFLISWLMALIDEYWCKLINKLSLYICN